MYPQPPNQTPVNPNNYDFIVNPGAPVKRSPLVGSSLTSRIVVVVVGLFVLLILFVGAKNLLSGGGGNMAAMIKIVNQQQELISLTTAATSGEQPLSSNSSTVAITTQVSLTSAQAQLLAYLKKSGIKVAKNQLIYPGGAAITAQLTAAAAAGTYDATLQQVLNTQLLNYKLSLKQAYAKTSGAHGKELLQKDYDGAGLLLRQFNPKS